MKSLLSQYKAVQDLPLSDILKAMNISEEKLYSLMEMWLCQGNLPPVQPLFKILKERHDERLKKKRQERQRQIMLHYRALRRKNYPKWKIAKEMHCAPEQLNALLKQWYNHLRGEGYSNAEIAEELHVSKNELNPIIFAYNERKRLHEAMCRQRIAENKRYARLHLERLQQAASGKDYFIFDTEAVQCPDELIEIAIINYRGDVVYNTLIRPSHKINWRITALTGITNEMVEDKPNIQSIMNDLEKITRGKTLMSWGIDYDTILLNKSSQATGIQLSCDFCCAQRIHMGLIGEMNQIALSKAAGCTSQNHRALDDCQLVLDVLQRDIQAINPQHKTILDTECFSTSDILAATL